MKPRLLVTGGCGKIGAYFTRCTASRYDIRIVDRTPWDASLHGDCPAAEMLVMDLQDMEACRTACEGMDLVIHLAADASPDAAFYPSLLGNNICTTYNIFEAAHQAQCQRIILASSVHAVAAYPADVQIKSGMPVNPANLYGVSKCFGEALAAYYATQQGLSAIVLRIGAYLFPDEIAFLAPDEEDALLDADDFNQLLIGCIETPNITFAIAHAISDNRFKRLDLTETRALFDYQPTVDAFTLDAIMARLAKPPA